MKLSLSKINRLATLKVSGKECISKLFDVLLVWKPIAIKKKHASLFLLKYNIRLFVNLYELHVI